MNQADVENVLNDPLAQELMASWSIPARLAPRPASGRAALRNPDRFPVGRQPLCAACTFGAGVAESASTGPEAGRCVDNRYGGVAAERPAGQGPGHGGAGCRRAGRIPGGVPEVSPSGPVGVVRRGGAGRCTRR